MSKLGVVLVDDHTIVRAGIRAEIESQFEVLAEAGSVAEAISKIRETTPRVAICDVHLPDGTASDVISSIQQDNIETSFLALSVSDSPEDVIGAIRNGARGYVTKDIDGAELCDAIRRISEGDAVFSPKLAGYVLDAFSSKPEPAGDDELDLLTNREQEVMRHLARGYAYKEIARKLEISIKTVESHSSSVLRKLQLSSRGELARWAAKRNII